jgi:aminopeptidase N
MFFCRCQAFIAGACTVAILASCSSVKTNNHVIAAPQGELNLTQEYAAMRMQTVHNIQYQLRLALDAERDTFTGIEQIEFTLTSIPSALALDFRKGQIAQLTINSVSLGNSTNDSQRVTLPTRALKLGANHVTIEFTQHYSHEGRGLYRFKDPEDGRIYLYSQFETFDANQMFPCFDQPDLKATLKLTVLAPKDWTVVSATTEESVTNDGSSKQWIFTQTPLLSTYLFSLHAGPYKIWKSQAGTIPLRLFARQSMARYVKPEQWFHITREGLTFYGKYFGYAYPFHKYDQLIVPDFNAGAMENVAAVTFSEAFIHRGGETREERRGLASVILHEMAHMWFGDLVTMNWWNGLWLNESFATYMSAVALARATEFTDSWQDFYSHSKRGAYYEDQLTTTHPINGEVPDTNSAFVNFDAITYGKGASTLKQLAFFVGEEKFRAGVQRYFRDYQYKNTTLAEFIDAIEKSSGQNLQQWADLWLEHKGLDTLQASFQCRDGKVSQLSLNLTPPEGESQIRPHRAKIGLYDLVNGQLRLRKSMAVLYTQRQNDINELQGEACPTLVYANQDDYDYVKVHFEPQALPVLGASLSQIADPLTRMMVWANLFEMVRDGELSAHDYIQLALEHLPHEKNIKTVANVLFTIHGRATNASGSAVYYLPQASEAQRQGRVTLMDSLEAMAWQQLHLASPGSDWQKTWFDGLVRITESPHGLARLTALLTGAEKIKSFKLDQDRRWEALIRLSSFAAPTSEVLVANEKLRDKSELGVKSALACEAVRPDARSKQDLLRIAVAEKSEWSLSRKRAVMINLLPTWQDQQRKDFSKGFYQDLLSFAPHRDPEFLHVYTMLVPTTCSENSSRELSQFLAQQGSGLPPIVTKPLRVSKQEEDRCVYLRAKAAQQHQAAQ